MKRFVYYWEWDYDDDVQARGQVYASEAAARRDLASGKYGDAVEGEYRLKKLELIS